MNSIERLENDSKNAVYKTTCACHDDEHNITFWIDKDEDFGMSLYMNMIGPYPYCWNGSTWYQRLWYRIKGALQILFTGYIVYQGDFMFRDRQHIIDFISALEEGIKKGDSEIT